MNCKHCGKEIVPTKALSQWMTPWLHVYSGYNLCDPGDMYGTERAEPTPDPLPTCKVCGDAHPVLSYDNRCLICAQILNALRNLRNTPARARLHAINNYIARGVDD